MNDMAVDQLAGITGSSRRSDMLVGVKPSCVKAKWIDLSLCATAGEAFEKVFMECWRHLSLNQQLFAAHRNGEALHQTRVALRRIRTALTLVADEIGSDGEAWFQRELKRASDLLGAARNLDKFVEEQVDVTGCAPTLRSRLTKERESAFGEAVAVLESERFQSLISSLVRWAAADSPATAEAPWRRQTPNDFATPALARQWHRLMRRGRDLADLDDQALHRVRITAKKMRYSCEFFESLFESTRPARHADFLTALMKLQERLGRLNDMATSNRLASEIIIGEIVGARTVPTILLARDVSEQRRDILAGGEAALRDLHDIGPFW